MIVRRDVVDAHPRLGRVPRRRSKSRRGGVPRRGRTASFGVRTRDRILGGRRNLRKREGGARRQDRASVAHLLAWTRDVASGFVGVGVGSTTRLLGPPSASPGAFVPASSSCRCSTRCPRTGRTTRTWCSWISSDARRTRKRRGRGDGSTHEAGRVVERRRIRPGREPRRRRRPRGVLSHNATVHGESAADDRRGRVRVRGRVARGEVRTGRLRCYRTTPAFGDWEASRTAASAAETDIDRPTVEERRAFVTRADGAATRECFAPHRAHPAPTLARGVWVPFILVATRAR